MGRALFIKIHLYLSAFFSAAVILVASSGGLYLLGVKGDVDSVPVATLTGGTTLLDNPSKAAVAETLVEAGIDTYEFDVVKQRGTLLLTRPTSTRHYELRIDGDDIVISQMSPSLQKRLMELHMGHGPSQFRVYQQLFAAGMLFIIISGLWLGLSSPRLRKPTALAAGSGLALFAALAFF